MIAGGEIVHRPLLLNENAPVMVERSRAGDGRLIPLSACRNAHHRCRPSPFDQCPCKYAYTGRAPRAPAIYDVIFHERIGRPSIRAQSQVA